MNISLKRIFDLLHLYHHQFANKKNVLAHKADGEWMTYNAYELTETCIHLAKGLQKIGICQNENIATILNNKPEWIFFDMAIMMNGAIHIPIYPYISAAHYQLIFREAAIKYVIIENLEIFEKLKNCFPEKWKELFIVSLDGTSQEPNVYNYSKILQLGQKSDAPLHNLDFISEDDVATIIYTSGTTGNPKGVMLTHKNIISNFTTLAPLSGLDKTYYALSILPLCHVYERTMTYMYLFLGISISFAENFNTIPQNLMERKPHIFCAVPRVIEKMYAQILLKGRNLKGIKKILFLWALNLGRKYQIHPFFNYWYRLQLMLARLIVFKEWKKLLGGNLKYMVSGSAALQPHLARIFGAAGITILEGYGLTEAAPVIATATIKPRQIEIGTVGKILPNVQVKLADDGEILCKGPNIMAGYYKHVKLTASVFDEDGWLHTGDIGSFTPTGYLKITDRKKEMFKNSLGKYVAPQVLENKFKESPFIEHIMVIGENRRFAAALIVPAFSYLQSWCNTKNISYQSNAQIITNPLVTERIQREVEHYNSFFDKSEQLKKFELLPCDWTIEGGELSPTLKLRRKYIMQKYFRMINRIYSSGVK